MVAVGHTPEAGLGRLVGAAEMLYCSLRASLDAAEETPVAMGLHAGSYARLLCASRQMFPEDPVLQDLAVPEPGVTSLADLTEASRQLAEALRERLRQQYLQGAAGAAPDRRAAG